MPDAISEIKINALARQEDCIIEIKREIYIRNSWLSLV